MYKATISTLVLALLAGVVLPSVVFGQQVDGPDYWWVKDNNGTTPAKAFRGIYALSETDVWVVGEGGYVYHRAGQVHYPTWTQIPNLPLGYNYYDFNDVCFVDADHGWIVGEKNNDPAKYSGVIYYTTNGGGIWQIPTSMPTFLIPTPFRKVKMVQVGDLYYGYISCGNGAVLITRNGGATWSRTQTDPWLDEIGLRRLIGGLKP